MLPSYRTRLTFLKLQKQFAKVLPSVSVTLKVGEHSEFPENRSFAHTTKSGSKSYVISVAPDLKDFHVDRETGLLVHEFGHIWLWETEGYEHSERDADTIGEKIFKVEIRYDRDDVQTIGKKGVRPRPAHLE